MVTLKLTASLVIILLTSQLVISQAIENGVIFEVTGGTTIRGELLASDSIFKVKLGNGTVVDLNKNGILKSRMPYEINLFGSGKYNYKENIFYNFEFAFGGSHVSTSTVFSKRFKNSLELGLGLGYHYNTFDFPSANGFGFIGVNSITMFANGKYYLLKNSANQPYFKAAVGFSDNQLSWEVTEINDGIMMQAGMGIAFASKKNTKWYLELTQYSLSAKGKSINANNFAANNSIDFDVWFNHIIFNVGLFFGN